MKKIGLVPKLIIGIIIGILAGSFLPPVVIRIMVTFSSIFSSFLQFVIPLMIIGFVVMGIAELSTGAGKLLGITTGIAYGSTIIAGSIALIVASSLFPHFIGSESVGAVGGAANEALTSLFTIPLAPMLDVTSAIVFAFMMGLCISYMRSKKDNVVLYDVFTEFNKIIVNVLSAVIIPLLPFYIAGTFANMAYTGEIMGVLSVFWKVFLVVLILHLIYVCCLFTVAGTLGKKNPLRLIKNQIPGYVTAVGTQSSAATIPVNVECAEKNGVTKQIRDFVVPLCATIHLAGSMITITCCATAVLMMHGMPHNFSVMLPFIMTLGIAMVAAPGAPGGAIMSALPFLPMIGIATESPLASLMIALYITQDSFGTAANVSGDNAIAVIVDTIYSKLIKKHSVN